MDYSLEDQPDRQTGGIFGLGHPPADRLAGLVQGARAGEPQALRALLSAVTPKMLTVVRRILGRSHQVEDVTQEAVFAFVSALGRFEGRCSVTHFACRIAVQTAVNQRRSHAAEKRSELQHADLEVDSLGRLEGTAEAQLERRRAVSAVRELILTLPEEQAEALLLHSALGFTISEIAASSGCPQETIRSRLRLGRKALRRKMLGRPHLALVGEKDGL